MLEREWQKLLEADSAARAALAASDPDAAYEAICWSRIDLLDDPQMPHVGGIYCAWAELEDLYEIGRTARSEFLAVVRVAMDGWLSRPAVQSSAWIVRWVTDTRGAVEERFKDDGTILDGKPF